MGLRLKIMSGFLILVFMLILAGIWSIYELKAIGTTVEKLLEENYKSINAARLMIEALERQDSGVLLLISGNWDQGTDIIDSSDTAFQEAFKIAQNNVTIPGEEAYVQTVKTSYSAYKNLWANPKVGPLPKNNLAWYFEEVHPVFLAAKQSVEVLMTINQNFMYQSATQLHQRANRAIMPGVVAFVSALVFTFLFNYFINHYLVNPIIGLTTALKKFQDTGKRLDIHVETHDEIEQLANVLQDFTSTLQK